MDTLSRDSNSSGSILPLVGVIAGGLALVLSIVALVKLSTLQKSVAAHDEAINSKIPALEASINAASAKTEADIKNLRTGVQKLKDATPNGVLLGSGKLATELDLARARERELGEAGDDLRVIFGDVDGFGAIGGEAV